MQVADISSAWHSFRCLTESYLAIPVGPLNGKHFRVPTYVQSRCLNKSVLQGRRTEERQIVSGKIKYKKVTMMGERMGRGPMKTSTV
jgi:hypothetical protein